MSVEDDDSDDPEYELTPVKKKAKRRFLFFKKTVTEEPMSKRSLNIFKKLRR